MSFEEGVAVGTGTGGSIRELGAVRQQPSASAQQQQSIGESTSSPIITDKETSVKQIL